MTIPSSGVLNTQRFPPSPNLLITRRVVVEACLLARLRPLAARKRSDPRATTKHLDEAGVLATPCRRSDGQQLGPVMGQVQHDVRVAEVEGGSKAKEGGEEYPHRHLRNIPVSRRAQNVWPQGQGCRRAAGLGADTALQKVSLGCACGRGRYCQKRPRSIVLAESAWRVAPMSSIPRLNPNCARSMPAPKTPSEIGAQLFDLLSRTTLAPKTLPPNPTVGGRPLGTRWGSALEGGCKISARSQKGGGRPTSVRARSGLKARI